MEENKQSNKQKVSIFTKIFGKCGIKDTSYDIIKTTKMNNFTHLNNKIIQNKQYGNIVIIGDSIAELYNTQEQFGVINTKYGEKIVLNRGISGDTSDKVLERLEINALNIKPSLLFFIVGTNDLGRGLTIDSIVNNVKNAIIKAKNSGVNQIVVESVYPVNRSLNTAMVGRRKNSDIKLLNEKLQAITTELNVKFASVFPKLCDNNGNFDKNLTFDGLHPNEKGYDIITSVLLPFIE